MIPPAGAADVVESGIGMPVSADTARGQHQVTDPCDASYQVSEPGFSISLPRFGVVSIYVNEGGGGEAEVRFFDSLYVCFAQNEFVQP